MKGKSYSINFMFFYMLPSWAIPEMVKDIEMAKKQSFITIKRSINNPLETVLKQFKTP
jgi:hypothetical protein